MERIQGIFHWGWGLVCHRLMGSSPLMYHWPEWARNIWRSYIILVSVRDIIFMWDLSSGRPPGCCIKVKLCIFVVDNNTLKLTLLKDIWLWLIFFVCLQRFYYTFLMVPISVCRIKMLAHQEVRCHDLPIIKNLPKSKPIFSKYSPLSRSNLSRCCDPLGGYQSQLSVPTGLCLLKLEFFKEKQALMNFKIM